MDLYDDVIKIVAPKKEKLAKAESEFAQTMAILEEKRGQLKKLEDALAELNEKLDEAVKQQTELQVRIWYLINLSFYSVYFYCFLK